MHHVFKIAGALLALVFVFGNAHAAPGTRVGVYANTFNDDGVTLGDFSGQTTRLLYREIDTDPYQDEALQKSFSYAKSNDVILQFGFETNYLSNSALVTALEGEGQLSEAFSQTLVLGVGHPNTLTQGVGRGAGAAAA